MLLLMRTLVITYLDPFHPHLSLIPKEVRHVRRVIFTVPPVVPVLPQVEGEGVPEGPGVPGEQGHELPRPTELRADSQ